MTRVLIVEDDAFIAWDLSEQLTQAGFVVVGPAHTASKALALVEAHGCDIAVLDVNLGGHTSESVAVELKRLRVPFVMVSGYAREQKLSVFSSCPQFMKPVQIDRLIEALTPRP